MPDLVLGTAQWGSAYGITNRRGRVDDDELRAIVTTAKESGVTAVDTALGYGDAQFRLAPFADRFWISTKVSGAGDVAAQVGSCLEQLQVTFLDAVMLHDWDALDPSARARAVRVLGACVSDGLIASAGVSVYDERGVDSAVAVFAGADVVLGIVQVPVNALDRRLAACSALREINAGGGIVQARSVFLQGLLVSAGGEAGESHPDVVAFHSWAADRPGGTVGAALAHVKALPWVSQVVVGASTAAEWSDVCATWRGVSADEAPEHLASKDEVLLDPRRW